MYLITFGSHCKVCVLQSNHCFDEIFLKQRISKEIICIDSVFIIAIFRSLFEKVILTNHLFNTNTTDSENGANKFFGNAERNISNDLQNFKKIFPIRGES